MTDGGFELVAVRKRYGPTVALDGVGLTVRPGEVHALLGENGAGKSTLVKIMAGAALPDAGAMSLYGRPYQPVDPLAARRAGVAMVYQELSLAPHLTVEQNLALGDEPLRFGLIDRKTQRQRAIDALAQLGRADIRPTARVADLPPAQRQLVEIGRALAAQARVVILDEPTSSLDLADIQRLFTVIRALCERGVALVYISHFLEEVQQVADRYTVLRDGRVAASGDMAGTSSDQLVAHMIGRRMTDLYPRTPHGIGDTVLSLDSLSGRAAPLDARLALRRGEIFGIAGLVGSGRTELLRTLFGLDPVRSGRIRVAAWSPARWTPSDLLAHGVGLLSEDRRHEGLAVDRSVQDNLLLGGLSEHARLGWLPSRSLHLTTLRWLNQLAVRARGPQQRVADLSGGNQQKIALARLLARDVDVLLLDEPTRGIDVGSKAQIYELIGALAAQGKAILLVSSYFPELLGICDSIAVQHRGRLGDARPASQWTEHTLLLAATGVTEAAA